MVDEKTLLGQYVRDGSEDAFQELVTRYVNLVYSSALRLVGEDRHLAEDVVQTVFADLARLARTLSSEVMLGGWLHRRTCHVAATLVRGNRRRQLRERQAVEMNTLHQEPDPDITRIAPILDEAINRLSGKERNAIVLRFFEQKDLRSVGQALGSSEDAAQKRVTRALEKLRLLLVRRGVTLSAASLATILGGQAVTAAPIGLAASSSATALAGAAATGGLTLGALKLIAMTKLKTAAVTLALVASGAAILVQHQMQTKLRQENAVLQQQVAALAPLQEENKRLAERADSSQLSQSQLNELLRLRGEVGGLRSQSNELSRLRAENQQLKSSPAQAGQNQRPQPDEQAKDYYPKESWAFAGYADPIAAFRSMIWAVSVGDQNVMLASMSPEHRTREEARLAQAGRTIADELAQGAKEMASVKSFRILEHAVISENEAVLTIYPEGIKEGLARARMQRIDNEWKFGGFKEGQDR